ncbi:MAG: hypothetical protein JXQ75_02380 [Phycisphaerae bacterium]|nr:hypothetical protein [Phycisphaerae bacterium]
MCSARNDSLLSTVFLTIGVFLSMSPVVSGHAGQHLGLKISISDEEVAYEVLLSNDFLNTLIPVERDGLKLSLDGDTFRFDDPEQEKREREALEAFFKDINPVSIDGVVVKPILKLIQFIPAIDTYLGQPNPELPPDLRVVLTYPGKGRPKEVSMVWEVYARDLSQPWFAENPTLDVAAELDAYDENRIIFFSRKEPEVIWHAPGKPVKQRVMPVIVASEPTRIRIPLVSVGIAVAWALGLVGVRFSGRWQSMRRRVLAWSAIPIIAVLFCHDVLVARVTAPWGERVKPPGERESVSILSSLHRNIYRAFDYKTESDIYDVLARSVDGPLLDQVYNEVYQGLIMRDQGGAVARVQSVDILEAEAVSSGVLPDSGEVAFRVCCRWRVHGAVYHWGHVHSRTNEYEAVYTVAQRSGTWKITGAEVLEQHRVVEEGDEPSGTDADEDGEDVGSPEEDDAGAYDEGEEDWEEDDSEEGEQDEGDVDMEDDDSSSQPPEEAEEPRA